MVGDGRVTGSRCVVEERRAGRQRRDRRFPNYRWKRWPQLMCH